MTENAGAIFESSVPGYPLIGRGKVRDIYDAGTMEGAARMIDGGSKLAYLYLTAARSAT